MPLFRIKNDVASRIEPDKAKVREERVHLLIEKNLEEFFGVKFVCHKPRVDGKEIDTLALDRSMKVPVIVEYKREKDRHVMEQVAGYCAKLRNNKLAAMQIVKENLGPVDVANIDWESPQVIIVAKEFTPDQVEEFTSLREVPRLFTFQFLADDMFSLEPVVGQEVQAGTMKRRLQSIRAPKSGPWDLEHFEMQPRIRMLYDLLDKGIVSLDTRVRAAKVNKGFIGYGATGYYFCNVKPTAKALDVFAKCRRDPPLATGLDLKRLGPGRWGPMTHTFKITDESQVEPALRIVKSALEDSL